MADTAMMNGHGPARVPTATKARGEIGTTGLRHWQGVLREEMSRDLAGDQALRVYSQMAVDPIVAATLRAIVELTKGAGYPIVPADPDDPAAVECADFVTGCLGDMSHSWETFWDELSTMFRFGWALFECVFKTRAGELADPASKYDDGRVGWRKWAPRPQDTRRRWKIDDTGGIQGMWQTKMTSGSPTGGEVLLPIDTCLLFRIGVTKNSPEGLSLLRSAYEPWYHRRRLQVLSAIGADRNLAGIPRMYIPSEILHGSTPEAQAALASYQLLGEQVRADETAYVMFPSDVDPVTGKKLYEIDLMSGAGTSGVDVEAQIGRVSREIAMSVLADVIFLGHEQVGTQALVKERNSLLEQSLESIGRSIADVFTRYAITRLCRLNGFPRHVWPCMEVGEIGEIDLAVLGQYISDLSGVGVDLAGLEQTNWLLRAAGMPEMDELPEEPTPPSTVVMPGIPADGSAGTADGQDAEEAAAGIEAD